ncbi:MAG: hypothetical protein LBV74_07100 [Tannerella sp.]|jgi:hypothetical protein|nr:hypothetical protein [Tannerella sp.]
MVKNYLFLLICILCVCSCSEENDHNTVSALKFVSLNDQSEAQTYSSEQEDGGSIWCTGNEIEWYNATTGELKVKTTPPPICGFPPFRYQYLVVFLDDKELLRLETVTSFSSIGINRPCITSESGEGSWQVKRVCKYCSKYEGTTHIPDPRCECEREYIYIGEREYYYIGKGYPRWDPKDRDESLWDWTFLDAEREKNWKAIEPGWNLFIEQLKKEGRYRE